MQIVCLVLLIYSTLSLVHFIDQSRKNVTYEFTLPKALKIQRHILIISVRVLRPVQDLNVHDCIEFDYISS